MSLERSEMIAALEALLFASDTPVSMEALCEVLGNSDRGTVESCVDELKQAYSSDSRGLQVVSVAGGYHIRTRGQYAPWVERLLRRRRKMRLSQAALETLAIVAYRQPVTKVEIESIRGVDAGGVLGTLLERNLVAIKGRSKGPGRPLLYATTRAFLDQFSLNDLEDLPSLEELEALMARREDAVAAEQDDSSDETVEAKETTGEAADISVIERVGPDHADGVPPVGAEDTGAGDAEPRADDVEESEAGRVEGPGSDEAAQAADISVIERVGPDHADGVRPAEAEDTGAGDAEPRADDVEESEAGRVEGPGPDEAAQAAGFLRREKAGPGEPEGIDAGDARKAGRGDVEKTDIGDASGDGAAEPGVTDGREMDSGSTREATEG
jgi:segregation and condensation protein B